MADAKGSTRRVLRRLLVGLGVAGCLGTALAPASAEKVFVYALEGAPESLDSAKASSKRSIRVVWLLCDALINITRDGQGLEPGLAESWALSPDGLRAVFKLRTGVVFHDGRPLDAQAVKASFERQFRPGHALYSPEPKNVKEQMLRELVEDIQVQDSLTVAFKFQSPGLHYLSQVEVFSPTALAKAGKEFGRRPVCAGPFRFASWSQDRIVLAANDRYWAGRPRIDRVVFRFIPEGKAVVDALLRGEVDFIPFLTDPVFFERVRESPRVKFLLVPGLNVYYLGFYTERPPFDNRLLRRAIAHAINLPRAVLFLGRGVAVAANGPLPATVKGHDPAVAQAAYDPAAATQLLARSGHASGLTVRLVHNSALTLVSEWAGAIRSDLGRVGVTVELLGKASWGEVVKSARAREGDMYIWSWNLRAPYPERLLVPLFHSRSVGTSNLTHYGNPALDSLLDQAVRLPEGPEQGRLYSQIQRVIVEDAPMVFLYHAARMAAHADRVQGLELNLGVLPQDKLVRVDLSP